MGVGMKVLSLFDGMACGILAMQSAGISVDRYVAFEIDKYAVQTSSHNFPMIEHRGDVFKADFTEFRGFDFLVGGSPCTYWSIAQKNNRETEASGMGWELFSQYVRALHEAQPMYFIYENNKSMANAIRESITETFGFEPICINSALVSAQNRQRLYWVGKRNLDGTYSRVKVDQPEDREVLLRDVLDGVTDRPKGRCVLSSIGRTTTREYFTKDQGTMTFEPVRIPEYGASEKSRCLTASYAYKGSGEGSLASEAFPDNPNKQVRDYVAEPVKCGEIGNGGQGNRIYSIDGKSVSQTATSGGIGSNTGLYAISVGNMYEKQGQNGQLFSIDGKSKTLSAGTGVSGRGIGSSNSQKVCIPVEDPCIYQTQHGFNNGGIKYEKAPTVTANGAYVENNKVITCFAVAVEWDNEGKPVKAISGADGKTYPVYEVKDGLITIKGKQHPIKLAG